MAGHRDEWSRKWDLNPRPLAYKASALPLSYSGGRRLNLAAQPGTLTEDVATVERRLWCQYNTRSGDAVASGARAAPHRGRPPTPLVGGPRTEGGHDTLWTPRARQQPPSMPATRA